MHVPYTRRTKIGRQVVVLQWGAVLEKFGTRRIMDVQKCSVSQPMGCDPKLGREIFICGSNI